jgi:hypothetical protein
VKRPFIKAGDPSIPYTDRKNLREELEGPLAIETIVRIQTLSCEGHSPYDIAKALQLTAERVYRVLDPEPADGSTTLREPFAKTSGLRAHHQRPKKAKVGYAEMKR